MFKRRSRYFYKYFMSYLLLLLLILTVIGGIVYVVFFDMLRAELEDSQVSAMNQFMEYMDMRMSELDRITINIASNNFLRPYRLDEAGYSAQEAVSELARYRAGNDFIYELALCVDHNNKPDSVYSSQISTDFESYFNYLCKYDGLGASDIRDIINGISSPVIRPAEPVAFTRVQKNMTVTYIKPIINSSVKSVVFYLINTESIMNKISDTISKYDGYTCILDAGGGLVITDFQYGDIEYPPLDVSAMTFTEGLNDIRIDNEDYTVIYIRSVYNKWSYILVTGTRQFMNEVYMGKLLFAIVMAMVAIFSALAVFALSAGMYRPVMDLMSSIRHNPRMDNKAENLVSSPVDEFKYISRFIDQLSDENKLYMKKKLLNDILHGNTEDVINLTEDLSFSGIVLDKQYFRVLVFFIENYRHISLQISEIAQSMLNMSVVDLMEELAGKSGVRVYGLELQDRQRISLLINYDKEAFSVMHIEQVVMKAQEILGRQFDFTVGVGNETNDIHGVKESFTQAGSAIFYRIIKGEGKIILYEDTEKYARSFSIPFEFEQKLDLALKQGKIEDARDVISEVTDYIGKNILSLDTIQYICVGITNAILKTMNELEMDLSTFWDEKINKLYLQDYESLKQFTDRIDDLCGAVCETVRGSKESGNSKLCENIFRIITNRYRDQNITLDEISRECGVSASYISRYFKDQTGYSTMQYIDKLRMDNAKVLLKTTNLTLKTMLSEVGYVSEANFIRKFKKAEGVTPMEYRKLMQPAKEKQDI